MTEMKPNPTLAAALRKAARRIADRRYGYNFNHMTNCNCGVLAQVVMGVDRRELYEIRDAACLEAAGRGAAALPPEVLGNYWDGIWSCAKDVVRCPLTNLPVGTILRALGDVGMTAQDLHDLELLDNVDVLRAAGLKVPEADRAKHVVRYMRAWADLIDTPSPVIELKPEPRHATEALASA